MNNRVLIMFIFCVICLLTSTSCGNKNTDKPTQKYVDIYDVVTEAYLTNEGYTEKIAKHMSKDVFNGINFTHYRVNNPKFSKPLKVNFTLKEVSQSKENDLVYIDMIYSIEILDSTGKTAAGSWNVPIQFTVELTANDWYIINKYEKP